MLALKALLAVLLLCCCGLGPGLVVVRRFRSWWPLERLCAAVGISLFAIYLAAAIIYGRGWSRWACYQVSGVCLVLLAASARDLYGMLRCAAMRRALLWLGLLVGWSLAALTMIRHYSGGGWHGDWIEHYERCLFFLGKFPPGEKFLQLYDLPARPPLMNLLGAFVMAQVGTEFPIYQVVFCFLNSLIFLPCVLLASQMGRRGGRRVALVGLLFALNPMFIQNVTYPWTKLLGGFYTVLAVGLYLRAVRKGDSRRLVLAVGFLAAGVLVHYSVAVYGVALAIHYLVCAFRKRRNRWREVLAGGATGVAVLATWLGWSIHTYGWVTTFASNTSVTSSRALSGWGNVEKIGSNLLHTIVPHVAFPQVPGRMDLLQQSGPLGYWRDYTFLVYQTNALIAMGSIGGLLVVWLFVATMRHKGTPPGQKKFWLPFVILTLMGGVAVVGEKDYFGVAHICLLPLLLVGVTFLAANVSRLRPSVRVLVAVGAAFDFAVGILLQLSVERMSAQPVQTADNQLVIPWTEFPVNVIARASLATKLVNGLQFWGDEPGAFLELAIAIGCAGVLIWMLRRTRTRPSSAGPGVGGTPRSTTSDNAAARP